MLALRSVVQTRSYNHALDTFHISSKNKPNSIIPIPEIGITLQIRFQNSLCARFASWAGLQARHSRKNRAQSEHSARLTCCRQEICSSCSTSASACCECCGSRSRQRSGREAVGSWAGRRLLRSGPFRSWTSTSPWLGARYRPDSQHSLVKCAR